MRFTLARRVFIAILLFNVALICRAFHIDLKSGSEGFSRYSYLMKTLISSEYGLTNFWSRDSASPMAVGEKHRLHNNVTYLTQT